MTTEQRSELFWINEPDWLCAVEFLNDEDTEGRNLAGDTISYLAVIPGLLAFLMVLLVKERPIAVAAKAKIDISLKQFPKAYWKYLIATGVFGIGNSSNAFLVLQTKDSGASLTTTILIYAGFNLVAALISYPAGFLSDKLGRRNILLLAFAIFFGTYLGFAFIRNIALIAVLFVGYGLYQGIFRSVGRALASDYVPERLRASGIGWYNTIIGLCGLIASLVAGRLWDKAGHPPYLSSARLPRCSAAAHY
jgi:Na+/melibiose symporter-like transporter